MCWVVLRSECSKISRNPPSTSGSTSSTLGQRWGSSKWFSRGKWIVDKGTEVLLYLEYVFPRPTVTNGPDYVKGPCGFPYSKGAKGLPRDPWLCPTLSVRVLAGNRNGWDSEDSLMMRCCTELWGRVKTTKRVCWAARDQKRGDAPLPCLGLQGCKEESPVGAGALGRWTAVALPWIPSAHTWVDYGR